MIKALTITDELPPDYKVTFLEVMQLINAWNYNMEKNYSPRYISCLDESMMKWFNKYTYPEFMFVTCKPWTFGNEWYIISCSDSGILFCVEVGKGKDTSDEPPPQNIQREGKLCL